MKYFFLILSYLIASQVLAAEKFDCFGTHGEVFGTGDDGKVIAGSLKATNITITILDDGKLAFFDAQAAEKLKLGSTHSETETFRRWSFKEGLVSFSQAKNDTIIRDLIYVNLHSVGQIGMMRRYECIPTY